MNILGIDVGGSGIKAALVDTRKGKFASERERIDSPEGFQPDDVVKVIARLVSHFDYRGPLGVGFPSVVQDGVVMSTPTSLGYEGWLGLNLNDRISEATGCTTRVLNDADVAGLAEMKFGNGRRRRGKPRRGVVMIFTLGTGIGSAMFVNGRLVPNLELGHLYLPNQALDAEWQTAERIRDEENLSWEEWGERLNTYFNHIERLYSPNVIIIGGGVSKKHDQFLHYINVRAEVIPAKLRNRAGIVGAAMAAIEKG